MYLDRLRGQGRDLVVVKVCGARVPVEELRSNVVFFV